MPRAAKPAVGQPSLNQPRSGTQGRKPKPPSPASAPSSTPPPNPELRPWVAPSHSSVFLTPYLASMRSHTAAPSVYHKACAYSVLGSLLTRQSHRCVLAEGVPRIWTNLWVVLVGDSGSSYKGTCIGMATEVLRRIDPGLQGPDNMSVEGVVAHLQEKSSDSGPCTLLVQEELMNLLTQFKKTYNQNLRTMLIQLYNVQPQMACRLKNTEVRILQPRGSLLAGINPEFLGRYGQTEDWLGGLFNRAMLVTGVNDRVQEQQPKVPEAVYDGLALRCGQVVDAWRIAAEKREFAAFDFSPEAE